MATHYISGDLAILLEKSQVIAIHGDIWDCQGPNGAFSIRFFEGSAELYDHCVINAPTREGLGCESEK